jgi:hypothetical protein
MVHKTNYLCPPFLGDMVNFIFLIRFTATKLVEQISTNPTTINLVLFRRSVRVMSRLKLQERTAPSTVSPDRESGATRSCTWVAMSHIRLVLMTRNLRSLDSYWSAVQLSWEWTNQVLSKNVKFTFISRKKRRIKIICCMYLRFTLKPQKTCLKLFMMQ